jgi:hypothetical protein
MRLLKRVIRRLAAPFVRVAERFLDNRFRESENRIAERVERLAVAGSASAAIPELLTHLGQRLRQLAEETREQGARIEELEDALRAGRPPTGTPDAIGSLGPLADDAAALDESVVAVPYVFTSVAHLEPGARVLVASGRGGAIPRSLAALGFRVTQVSRSGAPALPDVESTRASLDAWRTPPASFDAIVCSSFVESLGLDVADEEAPDTDADLRAMDAIGTLARPNAWLVFTAPFGRFAVGAGRRTYDRAALDRLLRGWDVHDLRVGFLQDGAWRTRTDLDRAEEFLDPGWPAVVLATARRSHPA